MLVDGEKMEFKAWLNQLKKEWVLGDCKPELDSTDGGQISLAEYVWAFAGHF